MALLYATPPATAPMILTLALCTAALGTLLPVLRDAQQLHNPFGRLFPAARMVGEMGPIVAMSPLLSQHYSTWQEFGLLLLFLALLALTAATAKCVKLQLSAITHSLETALMVPVILLVLLAVRGLPVLPYGKQLARAERVPLALYSSVASLSLVAVITDIGVRTHDIGTHLAAAMVFAALLSVLVFPTLGAVLLARAAAAAGRQSAAGA